jgi:hypothetical protein
LEISRQLLPKIFFTVSAASKLWLNEKSNHRKASRKYLPVSTGVVFSYTYQKSESPLLKLYGIYADRMNTNRELYALHPLFFVFSLRKIPYRSSCVENFFDPVFDQVWSHTVFATQA